MPTCPSRLRATAAVGLATTALVLPALVVPAAADDGGGQILVTEWLYQPADDQLGEFVELTNVGSTPVDLAGWTYDDDSADPAQGFDLSGFGVVAPGESVVFTDDGAGDFRAAWGLCEAVRVAGGVSPGLGRSDQINIYDADDELVDRLTYGDNTVGGPRTQGASAWVSAAGLGADDVLEWALSTVGDTEGSWAADDGTVGSPGVSTHGGYDPCAVSGTGEVYVTEWMYDGPGGEFVEITNVGSAPVDLTSWTYDDDSADPAQGFDLSGFGVLAPGESAVFVEVAPEAFRADWGLCEAAKVIGPYTNNLGRSDQINLFDADGELVDRLTYGDNTVGGIRSQNASGWVSVAGLGADDVLEWTLASVGDAEGSWLSAGGSVASPGTSTHGGYEACAGEPVPGAPQVSAQDAVVVGAVGDPTNPGTRLALADEDDDVADLTVTVASSDESVLPASAVTVSGTGAEREVSFEPVGRGTTTLTFAVTDPGGATGTATVTYGASAAAPDPSGRYHHHISDASAALDVGDGYVLLADDETNTLYLHRQEVSGPPVKTWTFTEDQLGTSGEIDFEGIARSGDLVVVTGSHGNSRSGAVRPERRTLVSATITGSGADTELTFRGRYTGLWEELRAWDAAGEHGLGGDALGFVAGTEPGVEPNPPGGFNVEAAEFAPDGSTLYLAFRAPTVEVDGVRHAVVVPVTNAPELTDGAPGTGPAAFGDPLLLDLDGRSIRALASNDHGDYLVSAGPSPQNDSWALYTWDGKASGAPQFNRDLPDADYLTGGVWESVVAVPHPLTEGAVVRLVTDSGDTNFYGTGATSDLATAFQKSYSQEFVLAAVPGAGSGGDGGTGDGGDGGDGGTGDGGDQAAGDPTIALSRLQVRPGETVAVWLTGVPGDEVEVGIASSYQALATVPLTGGAGGATVTIPAGIAAGVHHIQVRDGSGTVLAQAEILVLAADELSATGLAAGGLALATALLLGGGAALTGAARHRGGAGVVRP